ncbi:MAG: hypothetical protein MUF04_13215, partial [Akkermansiaceae bacterium]|nr:hypothetical protein [Akkermansiaceae bacterium]
VASTEISGSWTSDLEHANTPKAMTAKPIVVTGFIFLPNSGVSSRNHTRIMRARQRAQVLYRA